MGAVSHANWWDPVDEDSGNVPQAEPQYGIPPPAAGGGMAAYLAQMGNQPQQAAPQNGGLGTLFGMGMRQIPALAAAGGQWAAGQLSDTVGKPADQQDWAGELSGWMGEARQSWEQAVAEKAKTLAPDYQEGRQKEWRTTDIDKAAWADPKAVLAQFVESLPLTLMSMVPGGLVLRAGGAALKGALVMGGIEGAMGIAETAQNIASEISKADERELQDSPYYVQLRQQGLSDADARQALITETQGLFKPLAGGMWSAAMGAAGGYGLGKLVNDEVGRGILGRIGAGFAREAPTEALQGGGTQYLSATAAQQNWDPNRDVWGETLESGLQEGAIGGLSGGAFGAALGRRRDQPAADGTRDLTGNAGTTAAAEQAAAASSIPPPAVPPSGPTAAELAAAPDLSTPEGRQQFINAQAGEAPVAAPAPAPEAAAVAPPAPAPVAAPAPAPAAEAPVAEATATTLPKFGNGGAQKLLTELEPALQQEVLQVLTATPPEGKKGYSQKAVRAAINEARLQRRRLMTQKLTTEPLPTEYGTEQGGQMRLPNFPLEAGLAPEMEPGAPAPEAAAATGEAPVQGWLPGMNPERNKAQSKILALKGKRNAPPAQTGYVAPEEAAEPAPVETSVTASQFTKNLTDALASPNADTQRQLVSRLFNTMAEQVEGEKAAEQRSLFKALAAMATQPERAAQVATALSYMNQQGKLPAGFVNQVTGTPRQAAEGKPAAKLDPDNREALYVALAERDVTIKAEVNGKEATVTVNAADALRDADLLVQALDEIRRVCV